MPTLGAVTVGKTAELDMYAQQGATFSVNMVHRDSLTKLPTDLTGYTARMQVRRSRDPADSTEILSLTTENSRITLGGDTGTISLLVSASDMESITAENFVYDLELVHGSVVSRIVQGEFIVEANVTR